MECKVKKLENLFAQWKKECTPFIRDGFLTDKNDAKILFICRESNVSDSSEKPKDIFWMSEVVKVMLKDKSAYYAIGDITQKDALTKAKRAQSRYFNCIEKIAKVFECNLEECAYMNINKQGGGDRCDTRRLKEFAQKHTERIQEEIKIIAPLRIVILGNLDPGIINIIKRAGEGVKGGIYVYPKHPSVYSSKIISNGEWKNNDIRNE